MTPASRPASPGAPSSAPPLDVSFQSSGAHPPEADPDPILCGHCGRTARNGMSCQGMCVADSGY
ncbi:MAG: hypothetical protein VKM17_10465 [Cyanobacteriota bacterium]|nr:hypothetical protein [Cyanobacteriota bacterium]